MTHIDDEKKRYPGFLTFDQIREIFDVKKNNPELFNAEYIAKKFEIQTNEAESLINFTDRPEVEMNIAAPKWNK